MRAIKAEQLAVLAVRRAPTVRVQELMTACENAWHDLGCAQPTAAALRQARTLPTRLNARAHSHGLTPPVSCDGASVIPMGSSAASGQTKVLLPLQVPRQGRYNDYRRHVRALCVALRSLRDAAAGVNQVPVQTRGRSGRHPSAHDGWLAPGRLRGRKAAARAQRASWRRKL